MGVNLSAPTMPAVLVMVGLTVVAVVPSKVLVTVPAVTVMNSGVTVMVSGVLPVSRATGVVAPTGPKFVSPG